MSIPPNNTAMTRAILMCFDDISKRSAKPPQIPAMTLSVFDLRSFIQFLLFFYPCAKRQSNIDLTCDASLAWFVRQDSSTNHDRPRSQVQIVVRSKFLFFQLNYYSISFLVPLLLSDLARLLFA